MTDFHPGGLDAMWATGHFGPASAGPDPEQPDNGDVIPDVENDMVPEGDDDATD